MATLSSTPKLPAWPLRVPLHAPWLRMVTERLNPSKLGACVRVWREARGLTQEALADAIGITKGALSRWEAGLRRVDIRLLPSIAKALGVTEIQLLTPPDDPDMAARIERATAVAANLSGDDLETWLHMGERLASARVAKTEK